MSNSVDEQIEQYARVTRERAEEVASIAIAVSQLDGSLRRVMVAVLRRLCTLREFGAYGPLVFPGMSKALDCVECDNTHSRTLCSVMMRGMNPDGTVNSVVSICCLDAGHSGEHVSSCGRRWQ